MNTHSTGAVASSKILIYNHQGFLFFNVVVAGGFTFCLHDAIAIKYIYIYMYNSHAVCGYEAYLSYNSDMNDEVAHQFAYIMHI